MRISFHFHVLITTLVARQWGCCDLPDYKKGKDLPRAISLSPIDSKAHEIFIREELEVDEKEEGEEATPNAQPNTSRREGLYATRLEARMQTPEEQEFSSVDLIESLLGQTSRRQFVTIYDDTISAPRILEVLGSLHASMTDTVVLEYQEMKILEGILRSRQRPRAVLHVLMLCSKHNILEVFRNVQKLNLEYPSVRWLVISSEDVTKALAGIVREGTQVVVATKNSTRSYLLWSSHINVDDTTGFEYVGKWEAFDPQPQINTLGDSVMSSSTPLSPPLNTPSKMDLRRPLYLPIESIYEDFQGRKLLVAVVSNVPFFVVEVLPDGSFLPKYGIDYEIIGALADRLNFTYGVVKPSDGRWGGPEADGTVSGMIGMVARYEVHLAIDEITITALRETVVDFSNPYFLESTTLVSRAPKKIDPTLAVVRPFRPMIWILIILVTAIIGPTSYMFAKCHDKITQVNATGIRDVIRQMNQKLPPEKDLLRSSEDIYGKRSSNSSLPDYSFNMFRSLVVQGNRIPAHGGPLRIVLVAWFIFCIVVYSLYSGTLTAFMTIPSFERPINSPEDLLLAHEDGFVLAAQPGTSNEYFLKSTKSGIFRELWKLMDPSRSFPRSGSAAMEKVLTDDIVYMTGHFNSRIRSSQKGSHKFHLSKEKFLPQGLGIACRTGAPYLQTFNKVLLEIIGGGLVNKWMNEALRRLEETSDAGADSGAEDSMALSLNHLQAAFFILFGGDVIAVLALMTEMLYRGSRNEDSA